MLLWVPVAPVPAPPYTCMPLTWAPPASYRHQLFVWEVGSRELRRFPGMSLGSFFWEASHKKMKKGTGLRCLLGRCR